MRLAPLLLLAVLPCGAWDTPPHQKITRAALDSLPRSLAERFGTESGPLVEIYCIYPDRYVEMEEYGFVRKTPGPHSASEIRVYCVRPDGRPIHGATYDREDDLRSLVYLFERIAGNLADGRRAEAAQYAGVLSHFIADSFSPPHAVAADRLLALGRRAESGCNINLHAVIERSVPEFTLRARAPRTARTSIPEAAGSTLEACYAGLDRNRQDLPLIVEAACARDEKRLDEYRLKAAVRSAEVLADALGALLTMAERRGMDF